MCAEMVPIWLYAVIQSINVAVLLSKKEDGDCSVSELKDCVKFKMEGSGTKL